MTQIAEIEWTTTCCGECGQYAEVQAIGGLWLQIWNHAETDPDLYLVRRFSADKRTALDAARVEMMGADLQAIINS